MRDPTPSPDHDPVSPRLAGEGPKAYQAFLIYRDLGQARTLEAVRKSFGPGSDKSLRLMERWSGEWSWVARAAAYDDHEEDIRQRARDAALTAETALWERRRQEALHRNFALGDELLAKAREMIAWPLFDETTRPDGTVVRRPNKKCTFKNALEALRLATEIEAAVLEATFSNVDTMTPEQLKAVASARGRDPAGCYSAPTKFPGELDD